MGGGGSAPTPNPPSGDGDTPQRLNLGTYGILTLTTPPLKISLQQCYLYCLHAFFSPPQKTTIKKLPMNIVQKIQFKSYCATAVKL